MSIIYTYPTITPAAGDLLLLSDVSATDNPTKTATVQSVADLATPDTLEEVLTAGNTAENSIILTGDASNVTIGGNYTGASINVTGSGTFGTTLNVTGLATLANVAISAGTGTFSSVDINGGNIDGTNIGVAVQGTGTFTTMTADNVTATTSILGTLGGNVNHNNFNSTNVDIDSGKIDGTQIGSAVAAAGAFTTVDGPIGSVTPASGQFTTLAATDSLRVDTNTLFVSNVTSRVGIGTAAPNHTLQVEANSGEEGISIDGAQNQYTAGFRSNTTIGQAYGLYVRGGTNSSDSALVVEKADGSAPYFKVSGDGNVGIGTSTPNASAALDVTSTSQGFLPPRLTTAQRTGMSNVAGMIVYDTDTNQLWLNNGSGWLSVDVS